MSFGSLASDGRAVTLASAPAGPSGGAWARGAEAGARAAAACLGTRLAGVYLRGSAAKGLAEPGVSDMDLLVLHWDWDNLGPGAEADLLSGQLEAAFARELTERGGTEPPPWTKVEFRTLAVDPRGALSPVAQALEAGGAPPAAFCPPPEAVPWAYVLKTQAVCVAGWDLPAALPESAARWETQSLRAGLARRLRKALQRSEECRDLGQPEQAAAALRGGLKRCVRAAAELAVLRGKSERPSRDLFWCAQEAGAAFPKYSALVCSSAEMACTLQPLDPDLDAAAEACLGLGAWLDAELLAGKPVLRGDWGAAPRADERHAGGGRCPDPPRPSPAGRTWAAVSGAVLALRHSEKTFSAATPGRRLPRVKTQVERPIPALSATEAPDALRAMLDGRRAVHPIVVRQASPPGSASLGRLTLLSLAQRAPWQQVTAQISSSFDFRFCDPAALQTSGRLASAGVSSAPSASRVAAMPAAECLTRMLHPPPDGGGGGDVNWDSTPPLFFEGEEFVYLKSALPPALRADAEGMLARPPFFRGAGFREVQEPRLWAGPKGAVSPLHYDLDCSWLLQVQGEKRMLFFPAEELPRLYPYPDAHPLRRRARACPTDPRGDAWGRYPLFRDLPAWEASLGPGDAVFFPPRWAHYTESLSPSTSLTWRFKPPP